MRESSLVRRILKALKGRGGYWFKVHGHPGQTRGLPDIIGVYQGRFVGLEVKVPHRKDRVTELQAYTLEQIRQAGGVGEVVTSVQDALDIISQISGAI